MRKAKASENDIIYYENEVLELLEKYVKELNQAFEGQRFMLAMKPKNWLEINGKGKICYR